MLWQVIQIELVSAGDLAVARLALGNQDEHPSLDKFLDALIGLTKADARGMGNGAEAMIENPVIMGELRYRDKDNFVYAKVGGLANRTVAELEMFGGSLDGHG